MTTSYEQKADLLVSGFVKDQTGTDKEWIIPKEIIQLIILFYLLRIEHEMVFDKDNIGTDIEIISDQKIKFGKITGDRPYMSARIKYGISSDKSEWGDIQYISWKVLLLTQSYTNCMPFIGVVSNQTEDFDTNPFTKSYLLTDAYGIGASKNSIYRGRKTGSSDYPGLQKGQWVTVKYMIEGPSLVFENLKDGAKYEMPLPTKYKKITAWHPAIGLRYVGDTCEIKDVVVK